MQIWKNVAEKWWLENLHGFPDSGSNQKPNFTVPGALFDVFNGTLSVACSSLSSWWFHFNPFEKYARQIGSSPQVGVKIMKIFLYNKFETTTCSSFSSPLWTLDFGIGSLPPSSVALSVGTACLSQEPRGKIRGFDCLGFSKKRLPSRHLQNAIFGGYVSSLEGTFHFKGACYLRSSDVDNCRFGKGKTYKIKRSREIECIFMGLYTL